MIDLPWSESREAIATAGIMVTLVVTMAEATTPAMIMDKVVVIILLAEIMETAMAVTIPVMIMMMVMTVREVIMVMEMATRTLPETVVAITTEKTQTTVAREIVGMEKVGVITLEEIQNE